MLNDGGQRDDLDNKYSDFLHDLLRVSPSTRQMEPA